MEGPGIDKSGIRKKPYVFLTTRELAQAAVISALLLCVQVSLRVIPNVELVTVLLIVSAVSFRPQVSILAALVFCTGEWFIYGFGYWVVAYYLYWPMLALVSLPLKRVKHPAVIAALAVAIAVACTSFFGVLTTAVDAVFILGFSRKALQFFPIRYAAGIYFYITHVVSNAIIVGLLFYPLTRALARFRE